MNAISRSAPAPIPIHSKTLFTSGLTRQRVASKLAADLPDRNSLFPLLVGFAAVVRRHDLVRNQFVAVLLVPRQSLFDHADRRIGRANFLDLHLFAFQLLVVLEKALEDQQPVA